MTDPEFRGEPAGIVTRTLSAVLDALVVVSLLVAGWAGWAAVRFIARPKRFTPPSPSWATVITVGCVVAVLYLAGSWATSGRTYGAQLLGLRVLDRRGVRLGWLRSTARALTYVLFPIGLAWTVVDRRNRSVQDLVFGSRVVYDWVPRVEFAGPPRGVIQEDVDVHTDDANAAS